MVPTIAIPKGIRAFRPSILVQNALYWELDDGTILELDLHSHGLHVIQKPTDVHRPEYNYQILRTTENRLGFAITSRVSMGNNPTPTDESYGNSLWMNRGLVRLVLSSRGGPMINPRQIVF
jgi:hypothetical protein